MRKVSVTDILECLRSWNSIVVVGTSCGMKCFGFEFRQEKDIYFCSKTIRPTLGPIHLLFSGYRVSLSDTAAGT